MAGATASVGVAQRAAAGLRRQGAAEQPREVHRLRQSGSTTHRQPRQRHVAAASTVEAPPAPHSTSRASPNRAASSSPSSMSNLATYRLPERRPQQRWLDACIRDAVANLDEAPFLQAASLDPEPHLERFSVSAAVGDAPQLWDSIVRHLSHSAADTHSVLYVSPVVISDDDAAVSCMAAAACDTAREVLTGVATGSEAAPMLEGRIGDCCDDHPSEAAHHHGLLSPLQQSQFDSFSAVDSSLDSAQHSEAFKHGYAKASQILPYTPLRPVGHEPAQHTEGHMRAGSMSDGQVQRLWGVVVQSREQGGMEGCYVLKTLSSTAADCQCTSYTLTKMCEGDQAQQQLSRACL